MLWGLGISHPSEVAKLEERLTMAGFPTIDISGIEAAQVHSPPWLMLTPVLLSRQHQNQLLLRQDEILRDYGGAG